MKNVTTASDTIRDVKRKPEMPVNKQSLFSTSLVVSWSRDCFVLKTPVYACAACIINSKSNQRNFIEQTKLYKLQHCYRRVRLHNRAMGNKLKCLYILAPYYQITFLTGT